MDRPDHFDPELRRLLDAHRDSERMPPGSREAAWQRLQAAIQVEATDDGPSPGPRRRATWGALLLAAAALALLFAGLRGLVVEAPANAPASQAPHGVRDTGDATSSVRGSASGPGLPATDPAAPPDSMEPEAQGEATVTRPTRSDAPQSRRYPQRPVPDPGAEQAADAGLHVELSLLRRARAALAAASAEQALQLLDEHERRFPSGHLSEERMLLRVQALCAVGEPGRALTAARAFARAYPGSPHTPTIAATCRE